MRLFTGALDFRGVAIRLHLAARGFEQIGKRGRAASSRCGGSGTARGGHGQAPARPPSRWPGASSRPGRARPARGHCRNGGHEPGIEGVDGDGHAKAPGIFCSARRWNAAQQAPLPAFHRAGFVSGVAGSIQPRTIPSVHSRMRGLSLLRTRTMTTSVPRVSGTMTDRPPMPRRCCCGWDLRFSRS